LIDWKTLQMIKASGWPLAAGLLAPGADFNTELEGGVVPIHWACQGGKAGLVAHMIAHGANVDTRTPNGQSMLELAAHSGSFQVVMAVIDQLKAAAVPAPDDALRLLLVQTFRTGHPNSKNRLLQTLRDWDRIQRKAVPV
jgi:ankyrin repeat protein